jgi:hypothetical protein
MVRSTNKTLQLLPAALLIMSAAIFTCVEAQPTALTKRVSARPLDFVVQQLPEPANKKQNSRPGLSSEPVPANAESKSVPTTFHYEFSQPQFYVRHIVIEHDVDGRGKITFERLNEEVSVEEPLELSPAVLTRLMDLWQALKFLDSDENSQADKQFPHLGTMRIGMTQGARKRTAEFNWSNNASASALITEYRRVADQAIFVFDISVARENQPLNTPKLLEYLDSAMKRNWMSDPQQLVPLLKDISTDEHLPLIARNHALRILKKLEK